MTAAPLLNRLPGMPPLRLAILGSGSGSNAQSIIDAINQGALNAEIAGILTDQPDAPILDRAQRHGIRAKHLSGAPFKTKIDGEAQARYIGTLQDWGTEVVVLAGFMRIIKQPLLDAFPHRVLNIHPSLLPAFPGVHSWEQALDYGAKVAGCTVHLVDAGTDTGPIILQRVVAILDDDTPASLHARIQVEEHQAYPEAIRLLEQGALFLDGRHVRRCVSPLVQAAAGQKSP